MIGIISGLWWQEAETRFSNHHLEGIREWTLQQTTRTGTRRSCSTYSFGSFENFHLDFDTWVVVFFGRESWLFNSPCVPETAATIRGGH